MSTHKIIPLTPARAPSVEEMDALHERLESAGYMQMMQIGEPRLSELVSKYKAKGYDVEVVPYVDDGNDGTTAPSGGCGPGSCSSAGSSSGCSSGGCGPGSPPAASSGRRTVVPGVGTIYVRIRNPSPTTA